MALLLAAAPLPAAAAAVPAPPGGWWAAAPGRPPALLSVGRSAAAPDSPRRGLPSACSRKWGSMRCWGALHPCLHAPAHLPDVMWHGHPNRGPSRPGPQPAGTCSSGRSPQCCSAPRPRRRESRRRPAARQSRWCSTQAAAARAAGPPAAGAAAGPAPSSSSTLRGGRQRSAARRWGGAAAGHGLASHPSSWGCCKTGGNIPRGSSPSTTTQRKAGHCPTTPAPGPGNSTTVWAGSKAGSCRSSALQRRDVRVPGWRCTATSAGASTAACRAVERALASPCCTMSTWQVEQ